MIIECDLLFQFDFFVELNLLLVKLVLSFSYLVWVVRCFLNFLLLLVVLVFIFFLVFRTIILVLLVLLPIRLLVTH